MREADGVNDTLEAVLEDHRILDRFHDYELLEEISRGGMGVVYRARQISLNRPVALKMILAGTWASAETLQRFQIEAEATARLDHPHIVPIHEFGRHLGHHFICLKFVEGPNLAMRIANDRVSHKQAADWIATIARAVHYAHQRGVLHRDLKPSNILLTVNDEPMVTDFGLAKLAESDADLTRSSAFLGTPSYMPPEQAEGGTRNLTITSDVYSLGAILYQLLTGRPPFRAASATETLRCALHEEPVRPRQRDPAVPRDLETICLKCLNKDPRARYQSAGELADDLDRWARGDMISARPATRAERCWRWCRRQPLLASLWAAVALSIVALAVVVIAALISISTKHQAQLRESYFARIALAEKHLEDGDVVRAKAALFSCPESSRHWEWGHLMFLCHQEVWSANIHTNLVAWTSPDETMTRLRFDEAGELLETIVPGQSTSVWSVASGELTTGRSLNDGNPSGPTNPGAALSFELDETDAAVLVGNTGSVAATVDARNHLALWRSAESSKPLARLPGTRESGIQSLAFSPNDRFLFNGGRGQNARLWNTATGEEIVALDHSPGRAVFSPDESLIATFGGDYVVRIYQTTNGTLQRELRGHALDVAAGAFSSDNRLIATADRLGVLKIWSARPVRHAFHHPEDTWGMDVSPDGHTALTTAWDTSVTLWDLKSGGQLYSFFRPFQKALAVRFSPDGRRFAIAGSNRTIEIFDARTGQFLRSVRSRQPGHQRFILSIDFSPDGRWIASGGADGTLCVWDAGQGTLIRRLAGFPSPISALDFSPDGSRLACSSSPFNLVPPIGETEVRIYDTANWEPAVRIGPLTHPVYHTRFHPNGTVLACSATDRRIRLYNSRTGRLTGDLEIRHSQAPIAFAPDGMRMVVGSSDGDAGRNFSSLDIWNIETTTEVFQVFRHNGSAVNGARFSPDGLRLIASTSDLAVSQWEAFPWKETSFAPDAPSAWPERMSRYASQYWHQRLQAEAEAVPYQEPHYPTLDRSSWPAREAQTPKRLVDLTAHYNAFLDVPWISYLFWADMDNDLRQLPRGIQDFHGVAFDIRGLIRLRHRAEAGIERRESLRFPVALDGIAVGSKSERVHLLHGVSYGGFRAFQEYILDQHPSEPPGTPVAECVLHYRDGSSHPLVIRLGNHVVNWWTESRLGPSEKDSRIAWRGSNPRADRYRIVGETDVAVQICQSMFRNPFPDREIVSFDLVSRMSNANYFLIAITVEGP